METFKAILDSIPKLQYTAKRSDMGQFNDQLYEFSRQALQQKLNNANKGVQDLSEIARLLYEQQLDIGFIKDDLTQVKYFQCYKPNSTGGVRDFFIGQYNPRRADRLEGGGRKTPPQNADINGVSDTSCFLCAGNIRWQQRGIQLYYELSANNSKYNMLCNPFPFALNHLTIALANHEHQSWRVSGTLKLNSKEKIKLIVQDLYEIVTRLPGFIGFYNGVGAGATIEKHLHYHCFEIPKGQKDFPLQQAAKYAASELRSGSPDRLRIETGYPLTAFRLCGVKEEVIDNIAKLAEQWNDVAGEDASANIIAMGDQGKIAMYFVPRNRFYSRSPGMSGIVGGLEVLGEFIFCTESENQAINEQRVDYEYMWRILEAVKPPSVQQLM